MKPIVAMCSSRRFKPQVVKFAARLRELGFIVLEPPLPSWTDEEWEALSPQTRKLTYQALTLNHFRRMDKAQVVFFYNPDGYLGNGSTQELGYAAAVGSLLFAYSDKDTELARSCLFDGYAETPEKLAELIIGTTPGKLRW